LQAGFSPEQRIFFLLHAMQANGNLFLSFPALVFNSAHAGCGSFFSFPSDLVICACLSADDAISEASAKISILEVLGIT
jgi:hypothetical protein